MALTARRQSQHNSKKLSKKNNNRELLEAEVTPGKVARRPPGAEAAARCYVTPLGMNLFC